MINSKTNTQKQNHLQKHIVNHPLCEMEKIEKKLVGNKQEGDLFLKWGNKKRLRCVRVKDGAVSGRRRIRRKINSPFVLFTSDDNNDITEPFFPAPSSSTRLTRNCEATTSNPPEKDEKFYPTRGFTAVEDENCNKSKHVWPKLYIALTSKEKEEDFMAMKGCKPSHRPKKRPKIIQRTILLVSPGAWLSDMCQERYEVTEKKSTKKKPTGLKAMGSMESDSE